METYLDNAGPVSLEKLSGAGAGMAGDFLAIARDKSIKTKYRDNIHETMMLFFHELKKTGAEFGYRTASEILRFAAVVNKIEPDWSERDILDAAIMQKLLPKVHGSRKKLEPVLKTLGMLCLENDQEFEKYVKDDAEINYSDSSEIKYPLSLEKIVRMYKNLLSNGFTSFAEA
jgi:5-methylcytosine-specific restriction protein B